MPRRPTPSGGRYNNRIILIPMFDMEARFCYFCDLQEPGPSPEVTAQKQRTYQQAQNNLVNRVASQLAIDDNKQQNETINSAIEFLKTVAKSERNKEIRIINNYIERLKKDPLIAQILKKNNYQSLEQLIQNLQAFSNDPTSIDMKNFYIQLTSIINIIRNDTEYYKQRLELLTSDTIDKKQKQWKDIAEKSILFRMGGDVDTLIKSTIGIQQKESENSFSSAIRQQIVAFLRKNLKNNQLFIAHPYGTLVAIMIDFENFITPQYNKIMASSTKSQYKQIITELWEQYESQSDAFVQKLKNETKEALEIIEMAENIIGLQELKEGSAAYKKRLALLEKQEKSKTKEKRNQSSRDVTKIMEKRGKELNKFIDWKVTSGVNGQHGLLYELAQALKQGGSKIRGGAATDIIVLDIATIDIKFKSQIDEQVSNIKLALEESGAINSLREDRFSDLTNNYTEANNKIRAATNKINEMLEKNKIDGDVFIYHESLKLYAQVEEQTASKFHGRELAILNAIDSLYSANNIADLSLIDPNLLYNIAINLSNAAVGGPVKNLVENYLSIFAGLLMFDDIQNIAQDAAKNAINQVSDYGSAYNIHLYLLNDVYVPGSMLLTGVAQALEQGYNKITASAGAKVSINTTEATNIINDYVSGRNSGTIKYKLSDWPKYANSIASATKVQITFLTSFLHFIQDIQSYLS